MDFTNSHLPIMDYKTLNSHPTSYTSATKLLFASPAPSCQPPLPPRFDHLDHSRSMSCSIPDTAGTSDWLSRLRASKGFPDTENIGLDTFLRSIRTDDYTKTCTESVLLKTPQLDKPEDDKVADPVEEEDKGHLDLVGRSQTEFTVIDTSLPSLKREKMLYREKNVWKVGDKKSEGSKSRDGKKIKKSYKKQQRVRTCAVSKNSGTVLSLLPLTLTWNRRRKRSVLEFNQELKVADSVAEEKKGYLDHRVFDASPQVLKYGKMSYWNNNVWSDGDKGLMSRDRKKGKEILNENGDVQKKKLKRRASSSAKKRAAKEVCEKQKKLKMCNSVKCVDKGKAKVVSNCAQGHDQGKAMVAASEKKQDNCSQVQEKRVLNKPIDDGPSVILIKSIPITNKKDMSGGSKSCMKLQK